jgi:SPP1 gp7 family putative phage head morphogenesis protein
MANNSQSYWAERARKDKIKVIKTGEKGIDNLKRLLKLNLDDVERQIKEFYDKYGDNPAEKMTYAEWEKYKAKLSKLAKENPQDKALQKLARENIPKYRIDRLRALELDLQMQLTEATNGQAKGIYNTLNDVSKVSQATLATRMDKALGLTFNAIAANKMKQIIMSDWSGANWSERIWKDRAKVGQKLNAILEKGIAQGTSLQKMSRELRDLTGESFNNAFRLIRTETSHIDGQVTLEGYRQASKELGLEYYEYDAFLDSRTSSFCRELDGKRFKITDAEVGINYPPRHPNCRSTTQLVLDEDYEQAEKPKEMPKSEQPIKSFANVEKDINPILQDLVNNKDAEVKAMFANAHKLKSLDLSIGSGGEYNPYTNSISICNIADKSYMKHTLAHELGHYFDFQTLALKEGLDVAIYPNSYFVLKEKIDKIAIKKVSDTPKKVLDTFAEIMEKPYSEWTEWAGVSDIYCSLSKGKLMSNHKVPYGHKPNYYQKSTDNQYTEIFANYFSMRAENQTKQLQFLKDNSPELSTILEDTFTMYVKDLENGKPKK